MVSENTLTVEKQGLALLRGDDDFRLEVDRAVSAIYATGRMREIFEANLPGATPAPASGALSYSARVALSAKRGGEDVPASTLPPLATTITASASISPAR